MPQKDGRAKAKARTLTLALSWSKIMFWLADEPELGGMIVLVNLFLSVI